MTISGKITIDSYEPPRFTQDIDAAVDIPAGLADALERVRDITFVGCVQREEPPPCG